VKSINDIIVAGFYKTLGIKKPDLEAYITNIIDLIKLYETQEPALPFCKAMHIIQNFNGVDCITILHFEKWAFETFCFGESPNQTAEKFLEYIIEESIKECGLIVSIYEG